MGFETIHAARDARPAKGFSPRAGIGLVAGRGGKRVGRLGAPADEAVNLFLDVDERLFHGGFSISRDAGQSKDAETCRVKGAKEAKAENFDTDFTDDFQSVAICESRVRFPLAQYDC